MRTAIATDVREGTRDAGRGAAFLRATSACGEPAIARPRDIAQAHRRWLESVGWRLAACCLFLAVLLASLPGMCAFADDESGDGDNANDDGNVVNEQQLPDSSFIYDTSLFSLSGADSYYDNQTVQVVGEAIGDVVNADLDGTYKWVTLFESNATTGETATISVYMTASAAETIDTLGAYGKTGTTLQVRGTFQLACSEHDGISDLHATSVTVMQKGSEDPDEFNVGAFVPGIVLVAAGLLSLLVFYRLRESRR